MQAELVGRQEIGAQFWRLDLGYQKHRHCHCMLKGQAN